ncbi:MAG: hypothetical protein QM802_11550 [Agriterribacter sp.]
MNIQRLILALKNMQAETERKISAIQNREYGGNIVDDLLLKDYAKYFDSTMEVLKKFPLYFRGSDIIENEFQKLTTVNIIDVIQKRPFNIFTIFSSYLEGGQAYQGRFISKILDTLKDIQMYCQNLVYFLDEEK